MNKEKVEALLANLEASLKWAQQSWAEEDGRLGKTGSLGQSLYDPHNRGFYAGQAMAYEKAIAEIKASL